MSTRIEEWAELAGFPPGAREEEHELTGLFQAFRPDGDGVDRILDRSPLAQEILTRLKQLYAATAQSYRPGDAYFVPRVATCDEATALGWASAHIASMRDIAAARGDEDLTRVLDGATPRVIREEPPSRAQKDYDSLDGWIYEAVSEYLQSIRTTPSELLLLKEAFYSIANDRCLQGYLMWPLYASGTSLHEPFAAYFTLWCAAVDLSSLRRGIVWCICLFGSWR
jgi:hypothetical protein